MVPAFDTVFPADSVEFCPHPGVLDIFTCGTYKLLDQTEASEAFQQSNADVDEASASHIPSPQHRRGKCLVFEITSESESPQFKQIQEISLPAVPDIKWCHMSASANAVLGIADSEGKITLQEWQSQERHLQFVQSISCAPSDTLCLSLDWSSRRYPSTNLGSLIVSLSNGSLCLLRPYGQAGLTITDTWSAHEYEPWIAAWNYWDTNVFYSGGDDLKMKGWDIRQGFERPIFVNKRFDAGVTTIQSHPHVEHNIAVGSYDNSVSLFDTRKPLTPLTQVDVGGGAWRVKWHPSAARKNDLLVACMHDGVKVVKFNNVDLDSARTSGSDWQIVKRFDAHVSLAYGADWSFASTGDETLIGSCSFYDHVLHLWRG